MPSGEVLFARGSKDGNSTDEWDDTELLQEYDRAVRSVNARVAERLGMSVQDIVSATESQSSSKSACGEKKKYDHLPKSKKHKKRKKKGPQHIEWSVGAHCQALYSVDGKMYEATVTSLDHVAGTCCVQFVGYGNEEEVSITSLKQPMGSTVRRDLQQAAKNETNCEETENSSLGESEQEQPSRQPQHQEDQAHGKCKGPSFGFAHGHPPPNFLRNFSPSYPGPSGPSQNTIFHDMVTPPPPPHVLSHLPAEESEALSAMLMSWYMSGFHTGYFQGLKRAKNYQSSHSNTH